MAQRILTMEWLNQLPMPSESSLDGLVIPSWSLPDSLDSCSNSMIRCHETRQPELAFSLHHMRKTRWDCMSNYSSHGWRLSVPRNKTLEPTPLTHPQFRMLILILIPLEVRKWK